MTLRSISIAIPTYERDDFLIETLNQLLALEYVANEILVIDQTNRRQRPFSAALEALQSDRRIFWHRLDTPSIPKAMNHALELAKSEIVLFLDDDIELTSEIVLEHVRKHDDAEVACVAGRVVQPWEQGRHGRQHLLRHSNRNDPDSFRFNSNEKLQVQRFMGGNFSIRRKNALELGGFDENFVKAAYRFEAEFASRVLRAGLRIEFQPSASVLHLKAATGGTRSYGDHLRSILPGHSVGRYYYLLRVKETHRRLTRLVLGPLLAIKTKHHLTRPWWIPVTVLSELSGMVWALWLVMRGPRCIDSR